MMLVSSFKRFIYWHIPKTGGSSVVTALLKYIDINDTYYKKELADINAFEHFRFSSIRRGKSVGDHGFKSHFGFNERPDVLVKYDSQWDPQRTYNHINSEPGSQILMLIKNNRQSRLWNVDVKQFYEFTVVREPLDRIISIFNYMHSPEWTSQYGATDWKLADSESPFLKFAKIMAFYYANPEQISDFFDSQVNWACRPYTNNINVFKFEERDKWFLDLTKTLEIDNIALPHDNNTSSKILTRDMLTDSTKKFCYTFLEEEYDLLGY